MTDVQPVQISKCNNCVGGVVPNMVHIGGMFNQIALLTHFTEIFIWHSVVGRAQEKDYQVQGSRDKHNNIFILRFVIATTSVIYLIVVRYNSNNNGQVSVICYHG